MSIPGRNNYLKAHFRIARPIEQTPDSFALVTACNPHGTLVSAEENARHTRRLSEQLLADGLSHFAVTGFDPASDHSEPGFGIECDCERAVALGRQWQQEAIFFVDRGLLTLVSCGPGTETEPVGPWQDRVVREYA